MPLFFNILLRVIACLVFAYGVSRHFSELTPSGIFNVFQLSFLILLCVVPLRWPNILLIHDLTSRRNLLANGIGERTVKTTWPDIVRAANGLQLAEAIQETPIAKYATCTFVSGYSAKKAAKLQESLYKALLPAAVVSFGALLTAIVAQQLANQAKLPIEASALLSGVVQAYASSISFFWTIGCLYGEVDLARDIARSA
jgi:hypothetical protein